MADIKDTLISQIPEHVIESYPRFYDFLHAYYEWLGEEGNSYERIKHHMDYMAFEKSLDDYVDYMKHEYLSDVPDQVLLDKELFIKWSRKFNLARGSHASYKFLFRLLFGEQNTEIYLPKENILKTSDGVWVSGESLMLITHDSNNLEQFQFQRIIQKRFIYDDIFETATASVQRVRTKYVGRYVVTELSISNIKGEFKQDFPIRTDAGAEEWIIPVANSTDVDVSGSNYQVGQRVFIDGMTTNESERVADQNGVFDTRLSSVFDKNDITVFVNGSQITGYGFDGRIVTSDLITSGSTVKVVLPAYQGYLAVKELNDTQGITKIDILDLPIGKSGTYQLNAETSGTQFEGTTSFGLIKKVDGYYSDTKGQLSSNMYIQDSFFYQNYSYVIRTQQDFSSYADIIKQVLHPAGFVFFGQINYLNIVELLLTYQAEVKLPPHVQTHLHKYGLGSNYNTVNRFKDGVSHTLYRPEHFNQLDPSMLNGEVGYDLESKFLADRLSSYSYAPLKGWMNKFNWSDCHLYIPEDYSAVLDSGNLYFETGYVSTRDPETVISNDETVIVS